ncbi:transmembrane protein adipocyte-associated 1 [Haematococcus lacustris]
MVRCLHLSGLSQLLVAEVPLLCFALFLARSPVRAALQRASSSLLWYYYRCVVGVTAAGALLGLLQSTAGTSAGLLLEAAALLYSGGTLLVEVSVVTFLLQGYLTTGLKAVLRTLYVAGAVAGLDTLVQAAVALAAGIRLAEPGQEAYECDAGWHTWGFLMGHKLFLVVVYAILLVLPYTSFRDLLPAKRATKLCAALLFLNLFAALGAVLAGCGVRFGYCVWSLAIWAYRTSLAPLLYASILWDCVHGTGSDGSDGLHSGLLMWWEMRDAGVFDYPDPL